MAYNFTVTNLYDRYGQPNVDAWANMEGDGSGVTARKTRAINFAVERFDDRMRASSAGFVLPITDTSGATPLTVVDCLTKIAGYWLSTAHGVSQYDNDGSPVTKLYIDWLDAQRIMEDIATEKLKLDIVK